MGDMGVSNHLACHWSPGSSSLSRGAFVFSVSRAVFDYAEHVDDASNDLAFRDMLALLPEDLVKTQWKGSTLQPVYVLCRDHALQWIVVAVRGTLSQNDIWTDCAVSSVPFLEGTAHEGFSKTAQKLLKDIEPLLKEELAANPAYQLVFCGHSMGGALGAMCVAILRAKARIPETCEAYAWARGCRAYGIGTPAVLSRNLGEALAADKAVITAVNAQDWSPRASLSNATELLDDLCQLSVARTVARLVSGSGYASRGPEQPEVEQLPPGILLQIEAVDGEPLAPGVEEKDKDEPKKETVEVKKEDQGQQPALQALRRVMTSSASACDKAKLPPEPDKARQVVSENLQHEVRSRSPRPKKVEVKGNSKDKAKSTPEIEQAKLEALEKLRKLQSLEPKEARAKEWRALLRDWHPDKNPDKVEVAKEVFQFLQKGKTIINALPGALGGEERSVPSSGQEVEVKLLPRKTPGESLENKVLLAPRSAPLERRKVEPPVSLLQRGLRDLVAQPPVPPTERRVPSETSSPVGVRLQARRDAPTLHARRERDADPVDFDDEEERKRAKNHAFAAESPSSLDRDARAPAPHSTWGPARLELFGRAHEMAREVELAELAWPRKALPALPSHVLRAVDRLYQAQLQKAQGERERLERGKGAKNFTRWNKQELYLNEDSRERAKDASHRHLQRHPELWTLRSTELFEVVALQHLLEIDLEDLSLPPEERRSEDTFTGKDLAVCEQLLLDAPRELFDRLVAQLRITLGGSTVKLMRAVTCALSQSGLAHLEQACAPTLQVAVSGGEQEMGRPVTTVPRPAARYQYPSEISSDEGPSASQLVESESAEKEESLSESEAEESEEEDGASSEERMAQAFQRMAGPSGSGSGESPELLALPWQRRPWQERRRRGVGRPPKRRRKSARRPRHAHARESPHDLRLRRPTRGEEKAKKETKEDKKKSKKDEDEKPKKEDAAKREKAKKKKKDTEEEKRREKELEEERKKEKKEEERRKEKQREEEKRRKEREEEEEEKRKEREEEKKRKEREEEKKRKEREEEMKRKEREEEKKRKQLDEERKRKEREEEKQRKEREEEKRRKEAEEEKRRKEKEEEKRREREEERKKKEQEEEERRREKEKAEAKRKEKEREEVKRKEEEEKRKEKEREEEKRREKEREREKAEAEEKRKHKEREEKRKRQEREEDRRKEKERDERRREKDRSEARRKERHREDEKKRDRERDERKRERDKDDRRARRSDTKDRHKSRDRKDRRSRHRSRERSRKRSSPSRRRSRKRSSGQDRRVERRSREPWRNPRLGLVMFGV
eukprot:g3249.t1